MLQAAGAMDAAAEPDGLIAAAAGGDLAAFERLYRQFSPRVFGLCLRLTGQREAAEDCTQESFVAAWRALAGFERRSRFYVCGSIPRAAM
jgi:RNA polymerase sigma-70 factor, ECF subfamily